MRRPPSVWCSRWPAARRRRAWSVPTGPTAAPHGRAGRPDLGAEPGPRGGQEGGRHRRLPDTDATPAKGGLPDATRRVPGRRPRRCGWRQLRGPTLVNVWASWCGPCRTEAPFLAEAGRAGSAVSVIGVRLQRPRPRRGGRLRRRRPAGPTPSSTTPTWSSGRAQVDGPAGDVLRPSRRDRRRASRGRVHLVAAARRREPAVPRRRAVSAEPVVRPSWVAPLAAALAEHDGTVGRRPATGAGRPEVGRPRALRRGAGAARRCCSSSGR